MTTPTWILLTYKVPPDPARRRMALWRKLKSLGAVYLQNGVCVLPKSSDHLRQLKILDHEIADMGGEAVLLDAAPLDPAQEIRVVERFRADRDAEYRELIGRCIDFEAEMARETAACNFSYAELEENDLDLKKLKAWYAKIAALDFYAAPRGAEAKTKLEYCETLLEEFARKVFEAHAENVPAAEDER
jgi:DNA-binding transcriptional regulator PaaX